MGLPSIRSVRDNVRGEITPRKDRSHSRLSPTKQEMSEALSIKNSKPPEEYMLMGPPQLEPISNKYEGLTL